jgi:hypothetical protein
MPKQENAALVDEVTRYQGEAPPRWPRLFPPMAPILTIGLSFPQTTRIGTIDLSCLPLATPRHLTVLPPTWTPTSRLSLAPITSAMGARSRPIILAIAGPIMWKSNSSYRFLA